jgi:hypothetical protein
LPQGIGWQLRQVLEQRALVAPLGREQRRPFLQLDEDERMDGRRKAAQRVAVLARERRRLGGRERLPILDARAGFGADGRLGSFRSAAASAGSRWRNTDRRRLAAGSRPSGRSSCSWRSPRPVPDGSARCLRNSSKIVGVTGASLPYASTFCRHPVTIAPVELK